MPFSFIDTRKSSSLFCEWCISGMFNPVQW
jgi:hypothetical protein